MMKPQLPSARPTFEIDLNEKIVYFDSSSSEIHGENIIIIALNRRLQILALDSKSNSEVDSYQASYDYKKIRDIQEPEVRIIKLCSSIIVRDIIFATASKHEIKVFAANEAEDVCLKSIDAHDCYINSIDFNEDFLASGSDDHTCKIYSVKENYEEVSVLNFQAAVTCVKFNPEELNKIIISVKNGSLFIFCLKLRQSLYSFQTNSQTLMSFDWSFKNPCLVAVLAGDNVFYFDISKPDIPIHSKRLNDVGKIIKMHPQNPLVSATICTRAGTELKVIHQKSTIPIFSTKIISYANNIVWNGSCLITGNDTKICFFKIPVA